MKTHKEEYKSTTCGCGEHETIECHFCGGYVDFKGMEEDEDGHSICSKCIQEYEDDRMAAKGE